MSKVEDELKRHSEYKVPAFMHPDTPRGPDVTALDRQAVVTAIATKLQARMTDVLTACYAQNQHGLYWNIDPATGRILFGLPWAEYSHREWGSVRSECDVLRMVVRHYRQRCQGPFYFDRHSTRWRIDVVRYPTLQPVTANPGVWVVTPELVLAADNHRRGLPHGGRNAA